MLRPDSVATGRQDAVGVHRVLRPLMELSSEWLLNEKVSMIISWKAGAALDSPQPCSSLPRREFPLLRTGPRARLRRDVVVKQNAAQVQGRSATVPGHAMSFSVASNPLGRSELSGFCITCRSGLEYLPFRDAAVRVFRMIAGPHRRGGSCGWFLSSSEASYVTGAELLVDGDLLELRGWGA
jgi:hypothetical protein